MNRRDFFRSRQLARTAAQALGTLDELRARDDPRPPVEASLLRFGRPAMATRFEIVLPFGDPCAQQAAQAALDEVDRLEAQLTVFREDSEVSRLNRLAPAGPVPVEPGLFHLLETAARLNRETEGAFDVTSGALTKVWGFFRRQGRLPGESELAEALLKVSMNQVVLDEDKKTVQFRCPGLEINLGSIGKGYALDRAGQHLTHVWGQSNALLHGGHSSIFALGSEPGSRQGWTVGIRHPWDENRRLAILRLRNRALGTSAATFQHLEYNGRKLGHILDPRSGWPAEGIASASVVAPTAALADALATAFFIMGVDKTRAFCATRPEIGGLLLPEGQGARPVLIGLEPGDVDLLS
jgi:thiamine biosynthesis lipoprotein